MNKKYALSLANHLTVIVDAFILKELFSTILHLRHELKTTEVLL